MSLLGTKNSSTPQNQSQAVGTEKKTSYGFFSGMVAFTPSLVKKELDNAVIVVGKLVEIQNNPSDYAPFETEGPVIMSKEQASKMHLGYTFNGTLQVSCSPNGFWNASFYCKDLR
jgi:hypothetical protein